MPDDNGRLSRDEFLLEEYRALRDFIARNEAAGETRINLFLTLCSALVALLALNGGAALGSADGRAGTGLILLLVALLLVGRAVLTRTVHRNLQTTRAKHHADLLRGLLLGPQHDVAGALLWPPKHTGECEPRPAPAFGEFLVPREGGLVMMMALLNGLLCGALAAVVALRLLAARGDSGEADPALWAGGAAVAGFLLGWGWHIGEVGRRYRAMGAAPESTTPVADASVR